MRRRIRQIGEPSVPLTDEHPFAVTFITAPRPIRTGEGRQTVPIGTGFIVGWPSRNVPSAAFTYIVTASHVVQGENESYARVRTKVGGVEDLPVHEWVHHPHADVAASPLLHNPK